MAALSSMERHFTGLSSIYRDVRTTDTAPVEHIAKELAPLPAPQGADIGCGAGRYDLLMFQTIAGLRLVCIDVNQAMLDQARKLLAANGIDKFETRRSAVEDLELEPGGYDFVSTFNAIHHFDLADFLRRSRDGLIPGGHLFIYTRLPGQNARSIWGRHFPGFVEKETRLLEIGEIYRAIEDTPGLRFVSALSLRYRRRSSLARLIKQAQSRHYSTFLFYDPGEFEDALALFRERVRRRFARAVAWYDENVLVHASRDTG